MTGPGISEGVIGQQFVAGFFIDSLDGRVALVRKNRPAWQAGRLNAIGGHVEPGETHAEAMAREFEEETGVRVDFWRHFATVSGPWGAVRFYRSWAQAGAMNAIRTTTDEAIEIHDVSEPDIPISHDDMLPNLSFLLPLALYTHDLYEPIEFKEITP